MGQNFEIFCGRFLELKEKKVPMVVVTITAERGHAPQDVGARMIVGKEGILFGTVGGGKIEKRSIELAQELLASADRVGSQSHTWNLQRDVGMSCGGELSLLFEVFKPSDEWRIALFGAGHIVQELAPLLLKLECSLLVMDPRKEWLDKIPNHPNLQKKVSVDMPLEVAHLAPDTFVAIITMGHATDYPILKEALLHHDFPYLGVIGSKVKRIKIESDLRDAGLGESRSKSFFCPMGEDYGKNAPAEISISIAAQLLKTRRERFELKQ